MVNLKGLGVALITPFTDKKDIDFKALDKIIDNLVRNGADYIVALGTTAETPTLTEAERSALITFITSKIKKRIPIVVGFSGNNTESVCHTIQNSRQHKFDALLVCCPYYNKPSQEGLYQHFKAISEVSTKPIILYNVPSRTGVNLLPDTVVRIVKDCHNIIGIKEASGNVEQIKSLIYKLSLIDDIDITATDSSKRPFYVISGDDALTADLMDAGAAGVISVAANTFVKDFSTLVHSNYTTAKAIQNKYAKFIELMFTDGNPSGIKCIMSHQKKIANSLRLPLVPVGQLTNELISQELAKLKESK